MTENWAFLKEAKPFIQENFQAAGFENQQLYKKNSRVDYGEA